MASRTVPLSEFEKADTSRRFTKNKSTAVTFRLQWLLMGFHHNERFGEKKFHRTLLINSPFLKPPSVSRNCQAFKHASIISYTFISHLLTAAEWARHNTDKVAPVGLITVELFSVVVFTSALTGHEITVARTPKCTPATN